jgi:hypothetical protein
MGIFTKEVENEISMKLPTDKPVIMIRGVLKEIKYTRGKKGVEPVLIVEQNKHKYSIHCKEGIPPKDVEIGETRNFFSVEDVKVVSEYVSVLDTDAPATSSIDIKFNIDGGSSIEKKVDGNSNIYKLKRTKEKYYRLVGMNIDGRFL